MIQGPPVPFWRHIFLSPPRQAIIQKQGEMKKKKKKGYVSLDLVTAGMGESQKRQMCLMANAFVQRNHFHWPGAQLNL